MGGANVEVSLCLVTITQDRCWNVRDAAGAVGRHGDLQLLLVQRLAVEGVVSPHDRVGDVAQGIVDYPEGDTAVGFRLEGGHYRGVGPPGVEVAGLGEAVVVQHAPAQARPAVVELPEESAAAVELPPPVVLDAELQPLCLRDHGEVDVLFQGRRQAGTGGHQVIALVFRIILIAI